MVFTMVIAAVAVAAEALVATFAAVAAVAAVAPATLFCSVARAPRTMSPYLCVSVPLWLTHLSWHTQA
jgi:hypothetical protein